MRKLTPWLSGRFKTSLVTSIVVLLFSTQVFATKALIVNGGSYTVNPDRLHNTLTNNSYTYDEVSAASGLTQTQLNALGNYTQIWDIRATVALSANEKSAYLSFVDNGGKLFLLGENSNSDFVARNNDVVTTLNTTFGANGVTRSTLKSAGPFTANPNFQTPNQNFWFQLPQSGLYSSAGDGALIAQSSGTTACSSNLSGPGAVWLPNQLQNVNSSSTGLVVSVLDINFLQATLS